MTKTTPGWTRWYLVWVLAFVYAVNIADRYVVSTVMEPIRLDLHLTDSGIAVLTGVSLALFYVTIGIPISALADRANRRNIIAGALVLWSLMTVCCGLAQSFWQMLAARIGVGVGEAGGTPPSTSMLADVFPPHERPMALTFYTLGAPVGAWLGAEFAGRLADTYGWRAAFYGLGLPGVLIGLVIFLTVREPKRGGMDRIEAAPAEAKAPLGESLAFIFRQRAAMHLMMGGAVTALWGWGLIWWAPTFLMRAYGLSAGKAGALLGPMHLVAGSLATIVTARVMAMGAMKDPRRILWLMAVVVGLTTIPSFIAIYPRDLTVATVCLWIFVPALYFYIGPSFGLLQNVVPPHMRATATAVTLLMANIANLVLAPQLVGLVSDLSGGASGADASSLRFALLLLAPTGLWAAFHYWAAIRDFRADEDRATGLVRPAPAAAQADLATP
jgi:predicted MFS family arabinose efflux permease